MDPLALTLVVTSAVLHASWNLLAKRVRGSFGVAWVYAVVASATLAPLGIGAWRSGADTLSATAWAFLIGSALLHVGYFVSLQRGYGAGDLSLIYPLARGSGPALATVLAVTLLGERPGAPALLGTALVAASAFALAGGGGTADRPRAPARAVRLGLLTGCFIAGYTVWDATAVARIGVAPILYMWLSESVRALVLAPAAWSHRTEIRRAWRGAGRAMIGVGVLSPIAYLLVLYAFRLAPVSLVAPMREVSILITVALGTGLLREGQVVRRLLSAVGMAAGVALLAFARAG